MTRVAERLRARLTEAARHVRFYQRHWAAAADDLTTLDLPRDLPRLPPVTKRDLLAADPRDLLDDRYCGRALGSERTSGSSGAVFEMRFDPATRRRRQWRFLRALLHAGYRPGNALLIVSSQATEELRKRDRWMPWLGWHFADLADAPTTTLERYRRARPDVVYGPLTALMELGSLIAAAGVEHRPRRVVSTAEQLTRDRQHAIRLHFGVPAADFFGMTELGLFAWRLPSWPAYRIVPDAFHAEFVAVEGEPDLERLIVTDLRGGPLPLIRFDTGDLVRRERRLPGSPVVEFVGRAQDALVGHDGRRISPYRICCALEAIEGVRAFAVVQQVDRHVNVHLQCARESEPRVHAEAQASLSTILDGLSWRLDCSPSEPPREPGKLRPVRSLAAGATP